MNHEHAQRESVHAALVTVLESSGLKTSPSLRKILEYVVTEELEGRGEKIKAYSIGLDALGKPSSFNPQMDPSIRVNFGRLRLALDLHYSNEGQGDSIRIEIPKGTYRPNFIANETSSSATPKRTDEAKPVEPAMSSPTSPIRSGLIFAVVAAVLLFVGLGYFALDLLYPARETVRGDQREGNAIVVRVRGVASSQNNPSEIEVAINLVQQLRAALSRNRALSVVVLDGAPDNTEADADFAINAIVRKFAEDHKVSIELINGHTNALVWARSFELQPSQENPANETLVFQIVQELYTQVLGASKEALEGRDPKTLSAPQLFVMATWVPGPASGALEWEKERVELARLAIRKDPNFGPAHSVLADKLAYLANMDAASDTEAAAKEAQFSARRALELSPRDANTVFNVAQSQWHSGHIKDSIRTMKRVYELDPNHALARGLARVIPYTCSVAPDEVVEAAIEFDQSLGPDNPIRWVTLTWLGRLHLYRDEFDPALEAEKKAAQIFQVPYTFIRHAVILNLLGRIEEAAELIRSQNHNWPDIDPGHFSKVTIPRLCQEEADGSKFVGFYTKLTQAMDGRLN